MGVILNGATFENGPPANNAQTSQYAMAAELAQREDASAGMSISAPIAPEPYTPPPSVVSSAASSLPVENPHYPTDGGSSSVVQSSASPASSSTDGGPTDSANGGGGSFPPGGQVRGGSSGPSSSGTYMGDLLHITKSTHTMEGHLEHPDLPGSSARNAHAGADIHLKPRDYGSESNAAQQPGTTPTYHEDRPVVGYRTDMASTDVMRVHAEGDPKGAWATRGADINSGNITGLEARSILSLPENNPLPTHVSDVNIPVGTMVEASRPISGLARQYKLFTAVASWFSNEKKLG